MARNPWAPRRGEVRNRLGRAVPAAELPRCDDQRRDGRDPDERHQYDVPLHAEMWLPPLLAYAPHAVAGVIVDEETGRVLVDVDLSIQPEEVGVSTQEAPHIRLPRQHVELLVLEGPEVLRADLDRQLGL